MFNKSWSTQIPVSLRQFLLGTHDHLNYYFAIDFMSHTNKIPLPLKTEPLALQNSSAPNTCHPEPTERCASKFLFLGNLRNTKHHQVRIKPKSFASLLNFVQIDHLTRELRG